MTETLDRDLRHGATTVGPHRDDLRLSLGGRDLRTYGSAGQQRTAAIALRVLEAETLAAARGRTPIALYDDVFAELDEGRQARLLELIRAALPGQAVVAAPRDAEVPQALFDRPRWQMVGGRIEQ
jgi:DNA replication and repair protein RecF